MEEKHTMSQSSGTKRWKVRALSGLAVAMLLLVGSVAPNAQASRAHAPVTLTLWSGLSGPDQTGFKAIIDSFNSSQSAVQISYDQNAYTGYAAKLTTALSGGKGPNIWTLDAAGSINNEKNAQQANLDPFIKKSKILQPKNFPKALWSQYRYGGHQVMIPLYAVPLMMYYNKSLLKKAGYKTPVLKPASKVLAAAKKLTKGSNQYGMVIPTDWPMQFVWPTVLAQFGGKPFDAKHKKSLVDSKASVKALTFLHNLIYKYHTGPQKYAVDQNLKMLANGQAAQMFDGIWQYTNPTLQTLGKNEGISPVPQFGPKYKVFIGDLGFAAYKKNTSAENKAAIKFFEYFQTHSTEMAKVGDVPVYKPVTSKASFKKYTAAYAASKELAHGVYSVRYPNYTDSYLYDDALWPVLRGQSTDIKGDLAKAAQAITSHVQNPGA
jgi:multiple sugar transport system substrate-binding protein